MNIYNESRTTTLETVDLTKGCLKEKYDDIKHEKIIIYIPYSKEVLDNRNIQTLREKRCNECFSIINRGSLWYNTLTSEQQQELNTWYQAWLDVPQVYQETKPANIETIIPTKPSWLN